jgi:hypothetical protein
MNLSLHDYRQQRQKILTMQAWNGKTFSLFINNRAMSRRVIVFLGETPSSLIYLSYI